jgi:ribosomal-protein-alanine N-acetyltransferase
MGLCAAKNLLETDRLYLREVRVSDVNENYYRWLNDPEVIRFLETRYIPRSLENIRSFVERMDGRTDEVLLAICLRDKDRHIGNIKLGPINWIHGVADISLLIGEKDCWGKGYAPEAIALVCRHAFTTLNLRKVKAGCYAINLASKRAFEKIGFRVEGVLKGEVMIDRHPEDVFLLGLLATDFTTS